jgi:hypothetical protein
MRPRFVPADRTAFAATSLLLLMLCWKVVLVAVVPHPPRARELIAPGNGSADPVARRELLVAAPEGSRTDRRLQSLVRSYGHSLPVLLTMDGEGHVVRVQPVSPASGTTLSTTLSQ